MNWLERLDRLWERHKEVFKEEYERINRQRDTNTGQRSEHNTPTTDPVPVANSYDG